MRVLLYARYSTDLQDPLSIDTQLTMCRRELTQRKWTEVGCYTDGAQSGATIHRAGLQALLAAVGTGGVDECSQMRWTGCSEARRTLLRCTKD